MKWITIPLFVLLVFFLPTKTVAGCEDTPTPMASLNTESLIGTWYEYKSGLRNYNTEGKCASYEFSKGTMKGSLHLKVSELVDGNEVLDTATLTKQDKNDKSGRFDITHFLYFRSKETHTLQAEKEKTLFTILGTDSTCWTVIYTCDATLFYKYGRVALLTRVRDGSCLDSAKLNEVDEALKELEYMKRDGMGRRIYLKLQASVLTNIDQKGCGESTGSR